MTVRIARAATGRSKVAFCGYHGWHDWYLSANLKYKNNLGTHLMSGLEPNGVPKELKNTSIPFEYNNFKQIEKKISNQNKLAAIKMEVQRNFPPKKKFFKKRLESCVIKMVLFSFLMNVLLVLDKILVDCINYMELIQISPGLAKPWEMAMQ